jgi:phage baseplate assembly protein W
MAIILGSKLVNDTKEFNDYAVGISLPIQIGNTAFNQNFTTEDEVKTNIISLLSTKKGERIMQPQLGSGLQELLFEQNDDTLADRIEEEINNTIELWLPFVNVEQINVEQTDYLKDTNTVNVNISFTIGNNPQLSNVTFNITQ